MRNTEKQNFFYSIVEILHGIETYHDSHTVDHECRTGRLMAILSRNLDLDSEFSEILETTGSIHDIGKVVLSSYILDKPGALTPSERKKVEVHPEVGYQLIKKIKHPFAELAGIITLNHHENYDGSGYPRGLKGNDIPLAGRICRICDVYDAIRSRRPYQRENLDSHKIALEIMFAPGINGMYRCFDPELLETFQSIRNKYEFLYLDS